VTETEQVNLVLAAARGDREAFSRIYRRHVDTIFRFILRRVGNPAVAEDLTSETFLRALRHIGEYTWQGRDVGAWLLTIARHLVADHFRSAARRCQPTGRIADWDWIDDDRAVDPLLGIERAELGAALGSALAGLGSRRQADCLRLRFLDGLSVSETAARLGVEVGACKALQHRGLRAMARLVPPGLSR
jgi:RNA polymerase sigma-70 factor (ECF subfamily)